jgi:cell division protein FtsQ
MKKGLKITLSLAIAIVLVLLFIVIFKNNKSKRLQLACVGVNVEFADDYRFVTKKDIETYLQKDYGPYIGKRLDSLNLEKIENILNKKSAILKTDAYTTPDGMLNVRLWQRAPVVRFQKEDLGFYSDEMGFLFPLQSNFSSDVPVISGNIPLDFASGYKGEPKTDKEKAWLAKIIELAKYIQNSSDWKYAFSKISVDADGDLIMTPSQGSEKFIFGKPDDIEAKFGRMRKYYTAIVPAKGHYKTVNVKFRKQIVCRENIK